MKVLVALNRNMKIRKRGNPLLSQWATLHELNQKTRLLRAFALAMTGWGE